MRAASAAAFTPFVASTDERDVVAGPVTTPRNARMGHEVWTRLRNKKPGELIYLIAISLRCSIGNNRAQQLRVLSCATTAHSNRCCHFFSLSFADSGVARCTVSSVLCPLDTVSTCAFVFSAGAVSVRTTRRHSTDGSPTKSSRVVCRDSRKFGRFTSSFVPCGQTPGAI